MQQAFENNDPDDILRAKQLASTFIGPVPRPTGRIGATVRSSRLSLAIRSCRTPRSEKYSESVKLLDDARRRHVHSIYGEQVEQLKVDLIRLFRLRSFDG